MINFTKITTDSQLKTFAKIANDVWHEYFSFLLSPEQIDYMKLLKPRLRTDMSIIFLKKTEKLPAIPVFARKSANFFFPNFIY